MKPKWAPFLLVLAALLSVLVQSVNPAMATPETGNLPEATAMAAGCEDMMRPVPEPKKPPCSGTMQCMIAMGCLSSAFFNEGVEVIVKLRSDPLQLYWPRTAVLVGDDLTPEPDPPTPLT